LSASLFLPRSDILSFLDLKIVFFAICQRRCFFQDQIFFPFLFFLFLFFVPSFFSSIAISKKKKKKKKTN